MKTHFAKLTAIALLPFAMATLSGCNTVAGIGQDIASVGNGVSNTAQKIKQRGLGQPTQPQYEQPVAQPPVAPQSDTQYDYPYEQALPQPQYNQNNQNNQTPYYESYDPTYTPVLPRPYPQN